MLYVLFGWSEDVNLLFRILFLSFVIVCLLTTVCWTQTVPLYYDPLTGNLTLDATVSPDGTFSGYAIQAPSGGFAPENFTPFMGSVYTVALNSSLGEHDLTGFPAAVYSLGEVMPANLTENGLLPYRVASQHFGFGLLTKWGGGELLDFEWNYGPSPLIPVNQGVNGPPTPERWAEHARLLYSEQDGSLYLDSTGEHGGWLAMYNIQLESGEFQIENFNAATDGLSVAMTDSLTEVATGGIPEGRHNLGAVLPAGLSAEELNSRIHSASFIGLPGNTGGTLSIGSNGIDLALDHVPDPNGVYQPCDFDQNGFCDVEDLDSLVEQIATGTGEPSFDVTQDGLLTAEDITDWLAQASQRDGREYRFGDINLDGRVSAFDLNVVSNRWQQTARLWTEGDLNGDSFVNAHDLNALGKQWSPLVAMALPVPEPDSLWLVACAAVFLANGARIRCKNGELRELPNLLSSTIN